MQKQKIKNIYLGASIGLLISVAVLYPISIIVLNEIEQSYIADEKKLIGSQVSSVRAKIEGKLALALSLTKGIEAPYAIKQSLGHSEFDELADELISQVPYVRNIGLTKGTVFSDVYPLEGNEGLVGLDYRTIPKQWPKVKEAIEKRIPVIDGPLNLIQGGVGLIQRTPVYSRKKNDKGGFIGMVSIVIDVEKFLDDFSSIDFQSAIRKKGNDKAFWGDDQVFDLDQEAELATIILPDGEWEIAAVPREGWSSLSSLKIKQAKKLVYISFAGFVILAVFIGYHLGSKSRLYREFQLTHKQYLELLKDAPDAMVFVNQNGEIVEANKAAYDLLEYPRGQLVGLLVENLVPSQKRVEHIQKREGFFKEGVSRDMSAGMPLEIVTFKKRNLFVEINLGFSGEGTNKIVTATIRDVTERVRLENERNLAEEVLNEALETIPDGFVIYDAEDKLVICNTAYKEIYKTSSPAMVTGAKFEDIVRYGVEQGQYPEAGKTKESQEKWIEERVNTHLHPKGAILQQTNEGRWLKIEETRTVNGFIVGIRTDVTQIKEAEERLQVLAKENFEAKEKAEEATKAKSSFLAMISHELRTPMTGVLGLSDLVLDSSLSDEQKDHMTNLKYSAENLLALLNNILDYSKFEAGHLTFEKIDFRLRDVITSVEQLLGPAASKKGLNLIVTYTPNENDFIFFSDPVRLRQVLLNLTGNAIKFAQGGDVKIDVTVARKKLKISVKDSGIGIPENLQAALFKPFTQADETTTRKFGGTGLGLAICKMIVEGLDGKIAVESEVGSGTTFWFELELPVGEAEEIRELENSPVGYLQTKAETDKTLRVLLAEDNKINRKVISSILTKLGHSVTDVENGAVAVKKAKDSVFDLILMDMQMPEMDGKTATSQIRKLGLNIETPIIALTADVQAASNPEYQDVGITAFATKPVDWEKLTILIDEVCNH